MAAIGIGLVAAWLLLVVVLWLRRPRGVQLGDVVRAIPDVLRLAGDLLRDPAVPRRVKLALLGLLAWLVSPIDLIPEFIPVLGPVDDVVVAILVLRYAHRRLGADELRRRWRGTEETWLLVRRLL